MIYFNDKEYDDFWQCFTETGGKICDLCPHALIVYGERDSIEGVACKLMNKEYHGCRYETNRLDYMRAGIRPKYPTLILLTNEGERQISKIALKLKEKLDQKKKDIKLEDLILDY